MKMARLTVSLSALVILLMALAHLGENSAMRFCCTEYTENPIPFKKLTHYRIQKDTDICNIKAVIFRTVKDKRVCANPDSKWVQEAMKFIDGNKAKGQH